MKDESEGNISDKKGIDTKSNHKDDVFSVTMRKRVEQAKQKSVSQMLHSMKPQQKKSHKKLIAIIAGSLTAVLLLSSVAVYAFWYQNPDNVVTDAMSKLITSESVTAEGTISYGGQINVSFTSGFSYDKGFSGTGEASVGLAAANQNNSIEFEYNGDTDGDVYFRFSGLEELVGTLSAQSSIALRFAGLSEGQIRQQLDKLESLYQPAVDSIDDIWVLYGESEIRKYNEIEAREYECVFETLQKIGSDPASITDVGLAYYENRVVKVKDSLGVQNGNSGYVVEIDDDAAKKFSSSVQDTQLFKDLRSCSGNTINGDEINLRSDDKTDAEKLKIELWIDQWFHQLRHMNISDESGQLNIKINFSYDRPVNVKVPSDFTPFSDIKKELEGLLSFLTLNPFSTQQKQ